MKYFDWDQKKNEELKRERDISFEDILIAIDEGKVLDIVEHPNKRKFPKQKLFIVSIHDYAYVIPFVEDEKKYFLKTIFPSRKMTQKYIMRRKI